MPTPLDCDVETRPYALQTPAPQARFLPASLIRARAAALDPRNCLDLKRTARLALYGILAFIDARRPEDSIFPRRSNLCAESMLGSNPTLYRGLAELEARGYITRRQTRLSSDASFGRYHISRIWLQPKARILLGLEAPLTTSSDSPAPNSSFPQPPSIKVRGGIQDRPNPQQLPSEEHSPEAHHVVPEERGGGGNSFSSRGIDPASRIPMELLPLRERGLGKARICALMAIAKEQGRGQRLGAVVKVSWARIAQLDLRGLGLFRYLVVLLKQDKDWARLADLHGTREGPSAAYEADKRRLADKIPTLLAKYHGATVINAQGRVVGILNRIGETSGHVHGCDKDGVGRVRPVNVTFVRAWEEGSLRFICRSAE